MKTLIKSILKKFGLKLVKTRYIHSKLPKSSIENIEIVVRFFELLNRRLNILQIGACDGFTSDSIYPYIANGTVKAYLVEPSKLNFSLLSDFYAKQESEKIDVTLIQAAISTSDEEKMFYTVKNEGRWKDKGYARQLASFFKDHLIRHNIKEEEIDSEIVKCRRISSLMKEYDIKDLDALVIDTEGFDGEIVKMALNEGVCPDFIAFEYGQIVKFYGQKEIDEIYDLLSLNGYLFSHDARNTLAIKKSFLNVS